MKTCQAMKTYQVVISTGEHIFRYMEFAKSATEAKRIAKSKVPSNYTIISARKF